MAKRTFLLPLAFALAALTQTAEAQVFVNAGSAAPGVVVGWNYGHLSNCQTYVDGSTTWFYVVFKEGSHGWTNNPAIISTLSPACQTGNLIAVYVTSVNPLRWNNVYTYGFK